MMHKTELAREEELLRSRGRGCRGACAAVRAQYPAVPREHQLVQHAVALLQPLLHLPIILAPVGDVDHTLQLDDGVFLAISVAGALKRDGTGAQLEDGTVLRLSEP